MMPIHHNPWNETGLHEEIGKRESLALELKVNNKYRRYSGIKKSSFLASTVAIVFPKKSMDAKMSGFKCEKK